MDRCATNAVKDPCRNWFVSVFFLCCLFPFISPVPVGTDTQPLFLVFAAIIVFRRVLYVGLPADKYLLLTISLSSFFYINPSFGYIVDAGKAISLVAGIITFIAASRIGDLRAYILVKMAALIYFAYSCLIYINSDFFLSLQEHFVRGVNVGDFSNLGYRGVPALATEPGLLGGLLVFLLIQLVHYGHRVNASIKELSVYGLIIVLTIAMTKSGTGYLYLLIFLTLTSGKYFGRNYIMRICFIVAVIAILSIAVPIISNLELDNRGIEILMTLASGGSLDADTSVLKRLYDIRIGIVSLFDFPFGVGVNGVSATVNELAIRHDLIRASDFAGDISLVSGLSFYFVSYGLFGLLFIVYLFFFVSQAPVLHKVFAFIYLSASYSPAFPAIWILLSQTSKKIDMQR